MYLDVVAMKGFDVNNTDECIVQCIYTKNCTSINYIIEDNAKDEEGYCELLNTDRHRDFSKFENASEYKAMHFSLQVMKAMYNQSVYLV